ncbi:hypothetical protein Hanom_Chr12g01145621 [Helianthus anomalus]
MEREYGEAISDKKWDKKRECYVNKEGEPVVHLSEIVFDEVLAVRPLSGEYYSNREKDKTYVKRLDKIIRDAMTSSLRKRDEARMKKNVECMAVKVEDVKIEEEEKEIKEVVKQKVVIEEQHVGQEEMMKKDVESDQKLVGDQVNTAEKEKMTEEGGITDKIQTESSELLNKNELINNDTKIDKESEILKTVEQCKKCMET